MENEKKVDTTENIKDDDELKTELENAAGEESNDGAKNATSKDEVPEEGTEKAEDEVMKLKEQLEKKDSELEKYIELAQRVKAEFDNYKKRTAREKEQLYADITGDVISKLLPVIDNLERAVSTSSDISDAGSLISGMEMILKQFKDVLSKEGLEEIDCAGQEFDPRYHNAVMHVEDESLGENEIVEVFQKGYKIKDKIIRHSMVKVAN